MTLSYSYGWDISASQGLIVEGSGSASVSIDDVRLGLNSRTSGNSGRLRVTTSGDHSLRIWLVQCHNANFAQVDCPTTF